MMRNITVERTVAAPPAAVLAVLADYPNISDWNADGGESTMSYDFEADAKLGSMLDEQFTGGFNMLIDVLEQAAKARTVD